MIPFCIFFKRYANLWAQLYTHIHTHTSFPEYQSSPMVLLFAIWEPSSLASHFTFLHGMVNWSNACQHSIQSGFLLLTTKTGRNMHKAGAEQKTVGTSTLWKYSRVCFKESIISLMYLVTQVQMFPSGLFKYVPVQGRGD